MSQKGYRPEEIISKPREAEVLIGRGAGFLSARLPTSCRQDASPWAVTRVPGSIEPGQKRRPCSTIAPSR
jgi:hypothetical protein